MAYTSSAVAVPGQAASPPSGFFGNLLTPGLQNFSALQGIPQNTSTQQVMSPEAFAPTGTSTIPGGATNNIVNQLPALRSSGTGTAQVDPSLRPYLELGLRRAEQLFLGNVQPSLYPDQMYVSPSQQTLDALAAQEAAARGASPALAASQEAYLQSLGGIGQTAAGNFLMGSPFQQQAIQSATRPIQQQFEQSTLPALQSAFSKAGRYGSGAQARAIGQAQEATSRAMGDVTTNIAYQDYARERALQQQAQAQQAALAQIAPQIYGQQFLPAQQLAQVGQAQEQIAAQPLQEAIQRYQFQQQLPYQQLQGFLSSVYGTPLGAASYAQPQAQPNNTALTLGLLGTAASVIPKQAYSDAYDYISGFF